MKKLLRITTMLVPLIFGFADEARADPLSSGIIALVGSLGAGASLGSALVGLAVNFAFQTLMQALTKQDAPEDKGTKLTMDNGADKPPRFIIGTYGTPGHLLYHNGCGGKNSIYVEVIILSALPVRGLSSYVRINGRNCNIDTSTVDDDGFYFVEEYKKFGTCYSRIKFFAGGQTEADPFLTTNFGDDPDFAWTADMIVKGCAYVIVQSYSSRKGVWAGQPTYFFQVQGIPLYDPRRDSSMGGSGPHRWNDRSTWGGPGDDNTAVQAYNIVRGIPDIDGSFFWGGRVWDEAYRLPVAYWFAAMNVCDQNIEKKNGDIIKRYQTGAEISLDMKPYDVAKDFERSCSGYLCEYGGTYKFFVGEPGLSVMTLTDKDWYISEARTDDLFKPLSETYNSGVATYPEPRSGWSMEPAPLYVNDDYLADDGNDPLVADVQLPYVTEPNQVQRVVRAAVNDSRSGPQHNGVLPPEAFILEPFDVITWISEENGYRGDGVAFMNIGQDDNNDCSQSISIRAVNPNVHFWVKEMELDHTVGRTGVIGQGDLNQIFDIAPDWTETENGKDKPAIATTWDWGDVDVDVDKVLYEIRLHGTTKIIANGSFHNLEAGHHLITDPALRFRKTYDIHFYPKPISKRGSQWGDWQPVTLVDLTKPSAPALSVQTVLAGDGTLDYYLVVNFPDVAGEVSYVIKFVEVSDGNTERHRPSPVSRYKLPVSTGDHFLVSVATRAADGGSLSDFSNSTEITISRKAANTDQATSLTVTPRAGKLVLRATRDSAQRDFDHFNFYGSATGNFADAILIDDKKGGRLSWDDLGNGVTRSCWVTTVDKSGNESSIFPSNPLAGRSGTTLPIGDGDLDQAGPNVPGIPTLTTFTAELTGDNTVDTGLLLTTTAPAVDSTHPAALTYDFEIWRSATLGGTYTYWDTVHSPDLSKPFHASTKWFYKARSRGRSFANRPGTYSALTAVGVQPLQYSATVQAAANGSMTVSPIANGFAIKVPKGTDPNFKGIIYFANGVEIERRRGNTFNDLTTRSPGDSVTYTYQYMDSQDRVGAVSTPGVTVTYRAVQDGDVDSRVPNAPGVPTLTTYTAELTGDNTVDTGLLLTTTAPTVDSTHPAAYSYDIEIYRSATLGGAYTFWKRFPSPDVQIPFTASSKWFYKAQVAGRSFANRRGSFSALTATGVQPLQYSATVQAATGLGVTRVANGFRLAVPKGTDPNFKEIIYFANSVEIERRRGNVFTDTTARTRGDSVAYTFQYVDSQNRVGLVSGPVTVTYRGIQASDVEPGAINLASTDQTAPATPAAPAVSQVAKVANADGTVDMGLKLVAAVTTGATSFMFQIDEYDSDGTTFIDTFFEPSKKLVKRYGPVTAGHVFKVSVAGVSFNEIEGSFSSITTFTPGGKTTAPSAPATVTCSALGLGYLAFWTQCTDPDFAFSEIAIMSGIGTPSDANIVQSTTAYYAFIFFPSASGAFVYVRHVNRSFKRSGWTRNPLATPPHLISDGLVETGGIGTVSLADNAVNDTAVSGTNSGISCGAGAHQKVEEITSFPHGSGCNLVELIGGFRNNSGGTRTMDVSIEKGDGTVLATYANLVLGDNQPCYGLEATEIPSGSSSTYRIYVTMTTAGSVIRTRLRAYARKK